MIASLFGPLDIPISGLKSPPTTAVPTQIQIAAAGGLSFGSLFWGGCH